MREEKYGCAFNECFLCQHTLKEWKSAIANHRTVFHCKKGEQLFSEGDEVAGIYFIYRGKVKVHKKWGAEKELIVRFAGPGDIVGHRGLGSNAPRYPISATALEPVAACFIDLQFFEQTLKINYDFTYQLLMFFADELQESERKMRNLAHMPVKGRLAQALLSLERKWGTTQEGFIKFKISRQDLSSYIGTAYETTFRMLSELLEEGVISIEEKQIKLNNRPRLEQIVAETEGIFVDLAPMINS